MTYLTLFTLIVIFCFFACAWNKLLQKTFFISGSESDSVDDPVVGNVSKFCVVPPGYNGRAKKGHLVFDACFESGKVSYFIQTV